MASSNTTDLKPIKLYWRHIVPNPSKVIIILEELRIPYEGVYIDTPDLKKPEYEAVNPNGRVPAIHDPNTNLTLWESGAIVTYLIETYDKSHSLTYTDAANKWHLSQWEHFQASGHGPYLGQAAWFLLFHHEQLDSAKTRYVTEVRRIAGVLDGWLATKAAIAAGTRTATVDDAARGLTKHAQDAQGNVWLVANKCTYADLVFVAWNAAVSYFMQTSGRPKDEWDPETQFPHFQKWQMAMMSRPSFQKAVSLQNVEDVHL